MEDERGPGPTRKGRISRASCLAAEAGGEQRARVHSGAVTSSRAGTSTVAVSLILLRAARVLLLLV